MRRSKLSWCGCLLALALPITACNPAGEDAPTRAVPDGGVMPTIGPDGGRIVSIPSMLHLEIPKDERAAVSAKGPVRPILGGTLLVTKDGKLALASDPERDRISIVDLASRTLAREIPLAAGSIPFRAVEDDRGRAHVVLRGTGEVVTIDLAQQAIVARHAVCATPRGLAVDADDARLSVACASGELYGVDLEAPGDAAGALIAPLARDLRDVLHTDAGTFVSRFKSAELLRLDDENAIAATVQPAHVRTTFVEASGAVSFDDLAPDQAWRTAAAPDGSILMLGQGAALREIDIDAPDADQPPPPASPYGGGVASQCEGVVQGELTRFDADGSLRGSVRLDVVLPVDLAISRDWIAIAQAGAAEQDADRPNAMLKDLAGNVVREVGPRFRPGVLLMSTAQMPMQGAPSQAPCMPFQNGLDAPGQVVAVGFTPTQQLVVQMREPAQVLVVDDPSSLFIVAGDFQGEGFQPPQEFAVVPLGGNSLKDTGHDLFHRDAGAGIACASCHGEGGEDGHVWRFSGQGERRTQALHVGLEGTAPFHWDGTLKTVGHLMEEVFVSRMGGVHEGDARIEALQKFLFSLEAPHAVRASDDASALRGKALFEGQGECSTCHNGDSLTNNTTVDVGKGQALQVPSLVGVAYRAPYMHDGCARTLRERFDPSCGGGDKHGKTSQLGDAELDDLVAYLESL